MDALLQDVRHALRRLANSPRFAAVVVLTLAVGIAANTIIMSIAEGVLFRSLPYPEADRLVFVSRGYPGFPQGGGNFSYAAYDDILKQNTSFDTFAAYQGYGALALTGRGEPVRVAVNCMMKDLLFGVSPSDPKIYGGIAALLAGVALMACWIPARRATRLDPMAVLRGE